MVRLRSFFVALVLVCSVVAGHTQQRLGYYRYPAIWQDTIVFTAEGDLWRVPVTGGVAQRLTTHPSEETRPAVSPDGKTLAFSASYEGPTEVYTVSLEGGLPVRHTWEGRTASVLGWTPTNEVLYTTSGHSTLPNAQLLRIDPRTNARTRVPLAQAADGAFDSTGRTLVFTRLPFQGSHTRRYRGGTAQALWRFDGTNEATPLTADYPGTSRSPMVWNSRIYFLTDRDGTMNIWSMRESGGDLRQHTRHGDYDVLSPSLSAGRIAYQHGADIRVYDTARDADTAVPISLVSDFDQMRERWIKNPVEWITDARLSPTGDRVVITARGQLFVLPAQQGRIVDATRNPSVRYRQGRFFPDGKSLLALSDSSGEVEFWRVPANGVGEPEQLTNDGRVLRWEGLPSPDGKRIAHYDKDQQLWVYDIEKKTQKKLAESRTGDFRDTRWSPDSRWLVYRVPDRNLMQRLYLYNAATEEITPITSDRYDSLSPAWSPDGKWLYFLSHRHFASVVPSPWGSRQPEPFFDKQTKVYHVSLMPGERSPFQPDDELYVAPKKEDDKTTAKDPKTESERTATDASANPPAKQAARSPAGGPPKQDVKPVPPAAANLAGIEMRLLEVPVPPGNYSALSTDGKRLYLISRDAAVDIKSILKTFPIDNKKPQLETFYEDIREYELSMDGKKVMLWTERDIFVVDAAAKAPAAAELAKHAIPLKEWTFSLNPRDEWRQMFLEAWRLERDYFYDRGMHGLDWPAIREKYRHLAERVTDRSELSDVLAQMVSELSALHIFVRGGDLRRGQDNVQPGSLGGTFTRDEAAGGFRVQHIYRSDPDLPDEIAPLARPGVNVSEGDVITAINGIATLSVADPAVLLRDDAGKQVLLEVKPSKGGDRRRVVVVPITTAREDDLRYDEWEFTRRQQVESASSNKIGYVHLRAMGSQNMAEWQREFYPVFNREGLIIDVRHNRGGNIDSWILEKLLRKAWFYWQPRVGEPTWNMQYAFRGHVVVLCNEFTASDGEAFAEGFRRLGLGKIIGTRTWGGEIWLSASNVLVDRGIATAAEVGVFGPEGEWLIEGHGVDPDIVVDNLPHATFTGKDAQLEAAITFLQDEIARQPVPVPTAPKYPIKTLTGTAVTESGAQPARRDQ